MQKSRAITLIVLFVATVISGTAAARSHSVELFYFNPDSPQSNLSRLKRDMDSFLSAAGFPITFQPFAHLVDLENQLKEKAPAFLFVPEWYLKRNGAKLGLHPLLMPLHHGKAYYRKVLLAEQAVGLSDIHHGHPTVAMTSMGPDGNAILDTILFSPHGMTAANINAIIVPKDTDALFALALGQVDMALVAERSLKLISKINPNILHRVHPLLESKPIPMPVLCYTKGVATAADVQKLKRLFLDTRNKESRLLIMEMLQINGWQADPK